MHFGQMHVNIFKKYAFCNMHFSKLERLMSKNMHFAICIFQNWKYAKNRHFPRENVFLHISLKIPDFNQNSGKYAFSNPGNTQKISILHCKMHIFCKFWSLEKCMKKMW